MIPFLGRALILIALGAASFGAVAGILAGYRRSLRSLRWAQTAAYIFSAGVILANLVMVRALLSHDFSVSYVAKVGSRSTPTWVAVVSLWSSLEGSMLFWGAILGVYVLAFTYFYRDRYREYTGYALGVILAVATFFTQLVAGPANPFIEIIPAPMDGPGPNPLLQNHILMAIHPPTLYLGYVGLTIPFGIALAAVFRGKLSDGWLKPLRRWTLIPWAFLSVGIVLGGWWAYDVLGWGGYWAWDPVENASLLPWLAATGYLHSTIVHERRKLLPAWTLGLILAAFLLTIIGTFMTRSGVFNSVHAFGESDVGPIFLVFITIALVVSIGGLAGRAHLLTAEGRFGSTFSREVAFLLNNLVLVTFTFTVLLGTIYPLIAEALRGAKVSVGEPYFNQVAVPLGLMLVFLMGVGPALPWGRPKLSGVLWSLGPPAVGALVVTSVCLIAGLREPLPLLTFATCAFATVVSLRELGRPFWVRARRIREGAGMSLGATMAANRRRIGGHLVHLGVVMVVVGIAASHAYKQTAEASLTPGQHVQIDDYTFIFRETEVQEDPHRLRVGAAMEILHRGELIATGAPVLNYYRTQKEPLGTPFVKTAGGVDIYVSLLSVEPDGSRVALKLFINPLVSWIWWSQPLFVIGVGFSLWPRRRRVTATVADAAKEGAR